MRTTLIAAVLMAVLTGWSADVPIKPVVKFSKIIHFEGKTYYDASPVIAIQSGERLIPIKPTTPTGKQIKSEKFVQDTNDISMCVYEITYEDIPPPPIVPPVVPEVLVIVPLTNVVFQATTNGSPRGWKLKTMPVTNSIEK